MLKGLILLSFASRGCRSSGSPCGHDKSYRCHFLSPLDLAKIPVFKKRHNCKASRAVGTSITVVMDQWYRQNKVLIPWAILGLELAVSVGLGLYKINTGSSRDTQVVPSPLKTLIPRLSDAEVADLPYPPDAYPGARNVNSPYGSLRVYEWGPEDGRKVVLVHGITTPCVALGAVAQGLVDEGCRVILFDLPGRGYSCTPVPTPHSNRLYTSVILLALTSSPISWTGNGNRFSLIGYSLGGAIVATFTAYFPSLVSSLVLLAPGGLIRKEHHTLTNKFLYNTGLIPETVLERIIRSRLKAGDTPTKVTPPKEEVISAAPVMGEAPKDKPTKAPELSRARPGITVAKVIGWQFDNHPGFVKSFMSSIRYGPVSEEHCHWRRLGKRLAAQNAPSEEEYAEQGLQNGKVLIIGGSKDSLIVKDELIDDATEALGANNVEFEFLDAGHELPVTKSREIVHYILDFWQ